jgi:hypothetical protein
MLNEELVEEMYWLAHNSNVFDEFGKKIINELNKYPKLHRYEIIEQVFNDFVKDGAIIVPPIEFI